ncbi:MAG TPA: rhodanese-like domain-containing protein [Pyrinomonadaceae bacterium]|nr:rhodanese-like domain-containing protein [Pyrinomonadaceae bacterium]
MQKNFPLDDLENSMANLDKNKPVYVICQSGMRSLRGASMLEQAGFTEVYNVSGGKRAWMSTGLETER